jgi:hypothetical protein
MNARIALLSLLLPAALVPQSQTSIPVPAQTAMKQLSKDRFRAHMAFLADDLLEGRLAGTRGHEIAARYIAAQFEALGLKPAGGNGTYYQRVPLRETTVDQTESSVEIVHEGGITEKLKWRDDFAMGIRLQSIGSVEAPVIFAGYGVQTPDGSYDDYAGVDAKGKIVAILYGGPPKLPSELRAHVSNTVEKARRARDHGAIGLVFLWTPQTEQALPWFNLVSYLDTPGMRWLKPEGHEADVFPEIRGGAVLSVAAAQGLFKDAPKSWEAVLQDAKDSKAQAFALPLKIRLHTVSRSREVFSPNVAAVLPGSDPALKSEYVVYTAHSDHMGIGKPINGDAIYNGAGDNASGVAALLEIARAFRALPKPPARSILFLAVTAEEMGLLGSDYFAHFPTAPIQSIVADVNMDETSISYAFKDIIPRGAPDSTLGQVVRREASRLGLKVSPDPQPEQGYFTRSDQYSFVKQGVPSVFISEGYEAKDPKVDGKKLAVEWTATRYHKPSDDMSQPMDLNASLQFMQVNFLVGYEIANNPQRPRWNPGDFFGETFGPRVKP